MWRGFTGKCGAIGCGDERSGTGEGAAAAPVGATGPGGGDLPENFGRRSRRWNGHVSPWPAFSAEKADFRRDRETDRGDSVATEFSGSASSIGRGAPCGGRLLRGLRLHSNRAATAAPLCGG